MTKKLPGTDYDHRLIIFKACQDLLVCMFYVIKEETWVECVLTRDKC